MAQSMIESIDCRAQKKGPRPLFSLQLAGLGSSPVWWTLLGEGDRAFLGIVLRKNGFLQGYLHLPKLVFLDAHGGGPHQRLGGLNRKGGIFRNAFGKGDGSV